MPAMGERLRCSFCYLAGEHRAKIHEFSFQQNIFSCFFCSVVNFCPPPPKHNKPPRKNLRSGLTPHLHLKFSQQGRRTNIVRHFEFAAFFHRFVAADHVHNIVPAARAQDACVNHGAVAAGAVDVHGAGFRNGLHGLVDAVQRGVFHRYHVLAEVFAAFADVEYGRIWGLFQHGSQLVGGHATDLVNFHTGCFPGFKTAFEVADAVVVAHAGEAGHHLCFAAEVGHNQDLLFDVGNEGAYPGGKAAINTDIDGVGHKAFGEHLRIAGVEDEGAGFVGRRLKRAGRKGLGAAGQYFINAVVAVFVHGHVEREVGRWRQEAGGHFLNEFCLGHVGAQGVVVGLLVAEGVGGFFRHVFAAGRAGAVGRVHDHIVGQEHNLVAQGVEQGFGELLLGHAGGFLGQVGTTNVADKQGIAGEQGGFFAVFINQQVAGALHGMAGRVQHAESQLAHFELFLVFGDIGVEGRVGIGAVHDGRAGFFAEVDVAAHEVGVEVRFKNVLDGRAGFFGFVEVGGDFAERVNDYCFAFTFDVVGALCQAAGINLFDFHCEKNLRVF